MNYEFQRVAIVNRGEAAVRFIHATREFNQEHGTSLRTIALFADPDRHAMFVREADEAVSLGAIQIFDPGTRQSKSAYVDYERIEKALLIARAEAVWTGWNFLSSHADFADLCSEIKIVIIGPDGDVIRRLGDKIAAKRLAEQLDIPVTSWSEGPVETLAEARRQGHLLGYPLLMKASAGYDGRGMIRVDAATQLQNAFESARTEAFETFGNPTVFMEQFVQGARLVEVPIIADHYGAIWTAPARDCTIKRHHQKVLVETPSPALSVQQDQALREMASRLTAATGYFNAGSVEFLYEPQSQRSFFLGMNSGLQTEHPVTECVTGRDLVKLQIHVARGGRLEGEPLHANGHAIHVQLKAEDLSDKSTADLSTVERIKIPTGAGIRVDTSMAEGDVIPAEHEPTIFKLSAYGHNRAEALGRLQRALRESVIVLKGRVTNRELLLEMLNRAALKNGEADTEWLDLLAAGGEHLSSHADIALLAAAIEGYEAQFAVEQLQFYASAARLRPGVRSEIGCTVELRYGGRSYSLKTYRLSPHDYRVELDGSRIDVEVEKIGRFEYWFTVMGRRFQVVSALEGSRYRIEVDGVSHRVDRDDGGVVQAPSPAVVVSVPVTVGDEVAVGDRLIVLEAMKMEMPVVAPFPGKVRQIMTLPNSQVDAGAPLVRIESVADTKPSLPGERVVLGATLALSGNGRVARSRCRQNLDDLRQLMLGFDIDPAGSARLFTDWSSHCPADSEEINREEEEILNIFIDICSLFDRQPSADESVGGEAPSPEACLFSYLRMLSSRGEGLPPSFVERLRRALNHYGVVALDRTPELEQSLLWIFKSHQRADQQVATIQAVLERHLRRVETRGVQGEESFRALLGRLICTTRGLFPVLSDLAREVRYRYFDQPLFEQARRQVYARAEADLACLAADPEGPDRRKKMRDLVDCSQPLVSMFSGYFATAHTGLRQLMLEVLLSRHYRIRTLFDVEAFAVDRQCFVTAEYDYEGKRIHVFSTHAEYPRLGEAIRTMSPKIEEVPADHDVVIDIYIWQDGRVDDPELAQEQICLALNQPGFRRSIRRVSVAVAASEHAPDTAGVHFFTYRRNGNLFEEEKFFRGIHPMMGKRLHLWRLNNFKIERLPSAEDVYLLHAVARDNPKDERLFACAEVRDLTPVKDISGRIVQLPHLERMLMEALAGVRRFQSHRPPQQRLYWNRVLLYVWPPFNLTPEELHDIVHRLAPETEGLGLEQLVVRARIPNPDTGVLRDMVVRISSPGGTSLLMTFRPANKLQPIKPLSEYEQRVVRMRQRGLVYPYEIINMLTPAPDDTRAEFPPGDFLEHDLDSDGRLVPVERLPGKNKANIIVGLIRNFTSRYPEGITRVLLMGDPGKDLGAIAEPECRRILAALAMAEERRLPLEWFPISAGAKISMDSGVENMDWIARVLRRLIEFTQAGGEVNLVVNGINGGAQPYWNAEATMLMHTRGILIMTPKAAMVLTGKRALEFSGSISAEDNFGIGGYDRIMGLNGQAQYWARDIEEACHILMRHYEHTYLAPGEKFPRKAVTCDPIDRDVQLYPHRNGHENGFAQVGEIFSDETNPGRKKPFDIRRVMMAAVDQDLPPLERWAGMRGGETAVVWDAHLGGYPVCLIGIESKPVPRVGLAPADGPEKWTSGTLFPLSSKKVARAINAASNNRPVVLLANLSGFDGSPESMRKLQLEYGAEIGRAVVNFKGPMIFCVISRYHGGAYVVFSQALNEHLEVVALEGTYASVIGGAPAAAVVFAGEVDARARKDPRLQALNAAMATAGSEEKPKLRAQWEELYKIVHSEKLGEVAEEFDHVHSVQRARKVGALRDILPPANLRPYLIHAVERAMGVEKELEAEKFQAQESREVVTAA